MTWLDDLADKAVNGELPVREEALAVLASGDDELLDVVAAAFRGPPSLGRRVKLNYLVNIKSGLCPEDCFYCSQRVGWRPGARVHLVETDEIVRNAEAGVAGGARRVCLTVASGRGPTRPGVRVDRGVQVPAPRRRGVRLPGPALRRAGGPAGRGGDDGLRPRPERVRRPATPTLHAHATACPPSPPPRRRACRRARPDRWHGGDRRGPGGRRVRAARAVPDWCRSTS